MKLYLSSYRVGDRGEDLKRLVGKPEAKVAVIDNARDGFDYSDKTTRNLQLDIESMKSLEFRPTHIDLRNYFNGSGR